MPTLSTQNDVVDALLTLVTDTWDANTSSPLYYDNTDADRPATPGEFGRAIVRHTFGERASIGSAGNGTSLNRRFGDLYVQIFVPQGTGQTAARTLADAIMFAIEDAPSSLGVRLANTQINELGADGTYWQVNVVTSFTYDRTS